MPHSLQSLTADSLYRDLRERICLLDLPPGTPLRELTLAGEFGVSRTPVREALAMLRLDGLVTRRAGAGNTVATVDLKALRDAYSLRVKLAELMGDFLRVPAAERVVDDIRAVRTQVAGLADTPDARRLGELYNRLHEAMLDTLDNQALAQVTDRLFRQTSRIWIQLLPEMDWGEEVQVVLDEIEELMEALEGTSPTHVAEIRTKYMMMLLTRFNEYLTRPLI